VHVRGPDDHDVVLMSADWSARSVFLRTREPYPVETPLQMFVLIGRPPRRVALSGVVTRVVPHVPGSLHVREGMVIAFDKPQPELGKELEAQLWATKHLEVAQATPAVLVVGADPFADDALHFLRLEDYHVIRVLDAAGLADVLADGVTPRCVILSADCSHMLRFVASAAPGTTPPELVVSAGLPPQGLVESVGVPVLVLPAACPATKIPDAIKAFVHDGSETLEILRNAEEDHGSRFGAPDDGGPRHSHA
jgi:hypothetical protein